MAKKKSYTKVVDEQFIVPYEEGGGVIKFEAWEYENKIVKYNMAYITKVYFQMIMGELWGMTIVIIFIINIILEK